MTGLFDRGRAGLLAVTLMLAGCDYYECTDDLKERYVPSQPSKGEWLDPRTLELNFGNGGVLRPSTEVDPRRFALLRFNVKIAQSEGTECEFDICYRPLSQVAEIPESIAWDPAYPAKLRLNFADPIAPGSCDPWSGRRADFQALALIYHGSIDGWETEWGEVVELDPNELVYDDDRAIQAIGPGEARAVLEDCLAGGSCEFDEFCVDGYEREALWLDCP